MGKLFKNFEPQAIDLLRKLLVFDPNRWITVEEILGHPYLSDFHNKKDEVCCKSKFNLKIKDEEKLSLKAYWDAIYENISDKIKEHQ